MSNSNTTIVPAYGDDYKTRAQAIAAWNNGKDFRIADISNRDDGRYVNKSDATKSNVTVMIRYNKLTEITTV